jgi:hypothetical protein
MELIESNVFQSDSYIVNEQYKNQSNYLIEYNPDAIKEYCIIYFSSNNLYYPNNASSFTKSVIKKDKYEWYGTRINRGYKHIFLRDIKKQWYLSGINNEIDTPDKLLTFLRQETFGYKIILVGSSAGGMISIIMGQLLNAVRIYSFNGQFEIRSILKKSTVDINPIVFRNKDNSSLFPFYDTLNFITDPSTIFYFYSIRSQWDIEQNMYAKNIKINRIGFNTSNHGIPFLKSNLDFVINMDSEQLKVLSKKNNYHPLIFSLKMVGLGKTIKGIFLVLKGIYVIILRKVKLH